MSTRSKAIDVSAVVRGGFETWSARTVALGGVSLLTLSYFSVLFHFIDVTGNPFTLLVLSGITLTAALALSQTLAPRRAFALSAGLLAFGLAIYVISLPRSPPIVHLIGDALSLLTGRSMLLITNVDLWVLGVSPGPLFLTWYFALRRRYVVATLVGGATLGFLVLTGDASPIVTLLGIVGGVIAVGVGDIDHRGESLSVAEPLAVVLAGMILLSGVVSVVPAGPNRTYSPWSGFQSGSGADTVEGSLIDAGSQLTIQGNISLSPTVRFTVRSNEQAYWRVGSYDRFTGTQWVRTAGTDRYRGNLDGPKGPAQTVTQEITAEGPLGVLPAAWRPVSVEGDVTDDLRISTGLSTRLKQPLTAGDSYRIESKSPINRPTRLKETGTDYPEKIESTYTNVPSSTPDRVETFTDRITARADNPYDTARIIERWLKQNKNYSLNVSRPQSNVADTFLFERDTGYCTYFASTMAVMLRTQDIPARFTVGYTPGERVDRNKWVVRGQSAHAWVEVYFEDTGWVRFDPTPAGPREATERGYLEAARENNVTGVDTNETGGPEWTPTPTPTPAPLTPVPDGNDSVDPGLGSPVQSQIPSRVNQTAGPDATLTGQLGTNTTSAPSGQSGGDGGGFELPNRREATLGAFVLLGLIAGLRRLGIGRRIYRAVWLRYQPREEPITDAERAFDRLEYVLEKRYRPRETGETPRQYLAATGADERARKVALVRERARYAGAVTREEVDEAIELVDDIISEGRVT